MLWSILNFLSPLVSWAGLGTGITGLALAAAWFLPGVKRLALEIAAVAAVGTFLFWWGDQSGSARVRAQWDAAIQADVEKGNAARSDAIRDVERDGLGGMRNDRFNRDRK